MSHPKKKVLIYSCAAIGDMIISVPLIRNICRTHEGSLIDFFNFQPSTSDFQLQLLDNIGTFRKVSYLSMPFELHLNTWGTRLRNLLSFRREKYEVIYVFYLDGVPEWWKKLFKIITGCKKLYTVNCASSGIQKSVYLRMQMEADGMPFLPDEAKLEYPLTLQNLQKAKQRFSDIVVPENQHPFVLGISGKSNKCMYWPMERYEELLKHIIEKYDLFPIIIGAPSEKEKAESLLKKCCSGAFVCDLRAPEIIAFMKNTLFYLGNDTGTMHMADSAGIPCITLFTNKDPYRAWFPEGEHHINIIHQQQCGECKMAICPYGDPAPCIDRITVDEVEKAVNSIMVTTVKKGIEKCL